MNLRLVVVIGGNNIMEQYIPKDAVLAEIRKLHDKHISPNYVDEAGVVLEKLEDAICLFEVKEVDLEKEYNSFIETIDELHKGTLLMLAKHFFELGLKAQKDNIWHTMDETPNYPCDILFLTNVDNMFLYRYMENGRPVDMETPYFYNILNGKCWCYCNDIVNK